MRKFMFGGVAGGGDVAFRAWRLADAREDVIAGLTRCAAYTDDRQWLDCYYGAAQPMRAWLGLPPAPQSQLKLLEGQTQGSAPPPALLP